MSCLFPTNLMKLRLKTTITFLKKQSPLDFLVDFNDICNTFTTQLWKKDI